MPTQVHCTYVEIYNSKIYDLLGASKRGGGLTELPLKETDDGLWVVAGAKSEQIHSSAGLSALIERATSRRTTSSNKRAPRRAPPPGP